MKPTPALHVARPADPELVEGRTVHPFFMGGVKTPVRRREVAILPSHFERDRVGRQGELLAFDRPFLLGLARCQLCQPRSLELRRTRRPR